MASIVSLILVVLLAYAWGMYPGVLRALATARRRHRAGEWPNGPEDTCPSVAILLSAYNEEEHIEGRLRNLLELDYPGDKIAVVVGSDGSTDRTVEIARSVAAGHPSVRVYDFAENRGKAAVLRDLVSNVSSRAPDETPEALVFTDANTVFAKDALKMLVRHFHDAEVGGVCGKLVLGAGGKRAAHIRRLPLATCRSSAERTYWDWEARLKEWESALDSCLGANGAVYAIRRGLFWAELPGNTIVDDFVVGMKVREQGHRMIYDARALAYEELPETGAEWTRRVRIGAGDFQALALCRRCLLPRYGRFAWMFWSHKVLRWFTPHLLLLTAAVACAGLARAGGRQAWFHAAVLGRCRLSCCARRSGCDCGSCGCSVCAGIS